MQTFTGRIISTVSESGLPTRYTLVDILDNTMEFTCATEEIEKDVCILGHCSYEPETLTVTFEKRDKNYVITKVKLHATSH